MALKKLPTLVKKYLKKHAALLLGFILIKFILQWIAINPVYELQRDEYLHLDQARHLAWGYISLPPFSSWIAWLIKALGNGVFWVKLFPALFGVLTLVLVWKIMTTLKANTFALCLGSTAIVFSALVRVNTLFQPNSSDILFWTLFYFIIIKYISSNNAKWLYAVGIVTGVGLLSKYNFAFLLIGILPALLFSAQRQLFLKKEFYFSIGIALLIVLPNILWQYRNDFPTFKQLNELARTQLDNVNRMDFVKEQFLFFINAILLIIAAVMALLVYKPFKPYRFLVLAYAITIGVYIFLKAKGYYAIGLYPVLIAFGAVYLGNALNLGWKRYLQPVLLLMIVGLGLPLLLIALPYKSPEQIVNNNASYKKMGLLRWEDGKEHDLPQDFADMVGWKELAAKTDSVYAALPDKENTLVLCDNYGQAGAINYYSTFKNIRAVSMNADYINWIPLDKNINNVILIKFHTDKDPDRQRERAFFEKVSLKGKIENPYAIESGAGIYLLEHAKISINPIIAGEIKQRKEEK
jgi:hypothetical protein